MAHADAWKIIVEMRGIPEVGITMDPNALIFFNMNFQCVARSESNAKFLKIVKLKA
jgi:hypothetical protein